MGSTFLCLDSFFLSFKVDGRSGLFDTLPLIFSLLGCTDIFQKSNRIPIAPENFAQAVMVVCGALVRSN
jgi:hypothetical protein